MNKMITKEKINKTAKELEGLVKKSKRKLLELEVALNIDEIKRGNFNTYERAEDLIEAIKS